MISLFWNRMAGVTEQMISQGDLWVVVFAHDDCGQGNTTCRFPFECGPEQMRSLMDLSIVVYLHGGSGQGDTTGLELADTSIPERENDTAVPALAHGFFTQGWPKFDGVEKCKNRSAKGLCKREYLCVDTMTVARTHGRSEISLLLEALRSLSSQQMSSRVPTKLAVRGMSQFQSTKMGR